MIRRLLALLAICVGLAATAEPARASVSAVESVRLVEQVGLACGLTAPAQFMQGALSGFQGEDRAKICTRPVLTVVVPAVMLQADRAHE